MKKDKETLEVDETPEAAPRVAPEVELPNNQEEGGGLGTDAYAERVRRGERGR